VPSDERLIPTPDVVSIQASEFPAVHLGGLSSRRSALDGGTEWDGSQSSKA
jgi:hypothetical protein